MSRRKPDPCQLDLIDFLKHESEKERARALSSGDPKAIAAATLNALKNGTL